MKASNFIQKVLKNLPQIPQLYLSPIKTLKNISPIGISLASQQTNLFDYLISAHLLRTINLSPAKTVAKKKKNFFSRKLFLTHNIAEKQLAGDENEEMSQSRYETDSCQKM